MSLILKDDDYLKFGKHAGKKLEDVPAHWFLWMREQLSKKKKLFGYEKALWVYIEDNLEILESENN